MIPSYTRFCALLCFLKVADHTTEDGNDRLRKVRFILDHMEDLCCSLFKPGQNIAVDERMMCGKGWSSKIQYSPLKPVKWGFKVFAACDSATAICFISEFTRDKATQLEGLHITWWCV